MGTGIAWCDETINPIIGCQKVSMGCDNCYAEKMANRLSKIGNGGYQSVVSFGRWNGLSAFVALALQNPSHWKTHRSIFVGSMGDMFMDTVPFEWVLEVLRTVVGNPQHTFIFLTKRPDRMKAFFDYWGHVHPNLMLGVTAENQQMADERIPVLLATPAAKRFVSIEPMVGPVDLAGEDGGHHFFSFKNEQGGITAGLDGVILGGESGPKARPLHPGWVRTVRDQCAAACVPFMFKQWGEWGASCNHGSGNAECIGKAQITMAPYVMYHIGKKAAGNVLDGRTHQKLAWQTR